MVRGSQLLEEGVQGWSTQSSAPQARRTLSTGGISVPGVFLQHREDFPVCEDNPSSPCCRITVPSPEQTALTLQAVVVLYSLASQPPAWVGKSPNTEIPQLKGITPP